MRHFDLTDWPAHERLEVFQEMFTSGYMRADVRQLDDGVPMHNRTRLRVALPGLTLMSDESAPFSYQRSRRHLSDQRENLVFLVQNGGNVSHYQQLDREAPIRNGDATFWATHLAGRASLSSQRQVIHGTTLTVPRARLALRVADPEAAVARAIAPNTPALLLLRHYLTGLEAWDRQPPDAATAQLAADHLLDLLVLLHVRGDESRHACRGGVRAARLAAIKNDIAACLANSQFDALEIGSLTKRHQISGRYLRQLFSSEGTTFSDYLRAQRLILARRRITSPRDASSSINAIAQECGFTTPSRFFVMFRREFGLSPGDLRALALGARTRLRR